MKINRLEAHDRFLIAKQEENVIQKGFEECRFRNPDALALFEYSNYIYIFAHKREVGSDEKIQKFNKDLHKSIVDPDYKRKYTSIDQVESFRVLWQPRLTKPDPQTNSYLFRVKRDSTDVEVYWILPPEELWGQNKKGNITEDEIISESINKFKNNKSEMSLPHPEDLPLEKVKEIIVSICNKRKAKGFQPILDIL